VRSQSVHRHRVTKRVIGIFLSGMGVLGCMQTGSEPQVTSTTKPVIEASNARRIILDQRDRLWKDAASIRDAKIGTPYACTITTTLSLGGTFDSQQEIASPASCVCVELNVRNSYGGYVGLRKVTIEFSDFDNVSVRNEGSNGASYCPGLARFADLNGGQTSAKR
jgi:hypothetical protein